MNTYQGNSPHDAYNYSAAPGGQPEYPPQQYPPQQYPPQQAPGEDPGKTLGIVGFILAFVCNIAGLIVSIIARKKSKTAGFTNGLALAGIIISSLSVVCLVIGIIIGGIAIGNVVNKCQELGPGTHYVEGVTYTCS